MPSDYDGELSQRCFIGHRKQVRPGETVRWGLQGRSYGNDEAIDQAWGTAQEVSDDWIAEMSTLHQATSHYFLAGLQLQNWCNSGCIETQDTQMMTTREMLCFLV